MIVVCLLVRSACWRQILSSEVALAKDIEESAAEVELDKILEAV